MKNSFIFILFILILGIGLGIYFYTSNNGKTENNSSYNSAKISSTDNSNTSFDEKNTPDNTNSSNQENSNSDASDESSNEDKSQSSSDESSKEDKSQSSSNENSKADESQSSSDENTTKNETPKQETETQIAEFTTKIYTKDSNRQNNVSITCSTLNDTIVENGATFSFCNTVGKATSSKGYEEADVYVDGEKIKALGGGNCQVSSTLYNAVLSVSGLNVTERHEHSESVPYVSKGKDAAVAYGSCDFKFVNNTRI